MKTGLKPSVKPSENKSTESEQICSEFDFPKIKKAGFERLWAFFYGIIVGISEGDSLTSIQSHASKPP